MYDQICTRKPHQKFWKRKKKQGIVRETEDLRDGEINGRERETRDVGGGVAEQGVEVERVSRVDLPHQIGCTIRHTSSILVGFGFKQINFRIESARNGFVSRIGFGNSESVERTYGGSETDFAVMVGNFSNSRIECFCQLRFGSSKIKNCSFGTPIIRIILLSITLSYA